MPDFDLRQLTLGPAFKPRIEDVPTPQILKDQGAPDNLVRLVDMSAEERIATASAFGQNSAENMGVYICKVTRYRDTGGTDGNGTYVYGKVDDNGVSVPNLVDAKTIIAQNFGLLEMWAKIVKPFLGIEDAIPQAVAAAKNGSQATPSSAGGSESPTTSDASPSENASPESAIVISSIGSPS